MHMHNVCVHAISYLPFSSIDNSYMQVNDAAWGPVEIAMFCKLNEIAESHTLPRNGEYLRQTC
jgi:hypothetical protein